MPLMNRTRVCCTRVHHLITELRLLLSRNFPDNDVGETLFSVNYAAGKEENVAADVIIDSDEWAAELTSAAISTCAMSVAAAAAAGTDDVGDDWQMCDVETRLLPPDWFNYVSRLVSMYVFLESLSFLASVQTPRLSCRVGLTVI